MQKAVDLLPVRGQLVQRLVPKFLRHALFPQLFSGPPGTVSHIAAVPHQRGGIGAVIQRADGFQPLSGIAGLGL